MDRGLTHIAFMVSDLDASVAFYDRYARMAVVHRRSADDGSGRVAWISDGTRPFVIVLIEAPAPFPGSGLIPRALSSLMPHFAHLGVACESREAVDAACERAAEEGVLELGPRDLGAPVGYLGLIRDPDGNCLEVSFGQEVGLAVALGRSDRDDDAGGPGENASGEDPNASGEEPNAGGQDPKTGGGRGVRRDGNAD